MTCENCGKPCTEADLRTFPEPHYICKHCEALAHRAMKLAWKDVSPFQVATMYHGISTNRREES